MSEVDRLFAEYREEHRAGGEANPRLYIERVEGADRAELAALIGGYLERAPGAAWDAAAFAGSAAQRFAERAEIALRGEAGWWPELLPRLRDRAQITRGKLVERLAGALGVAGREQKVADYYHRMEHGLLPPDGVSDRVIEALGEIVGESAERIKAAGRAAVGSGAAPSDPAFARKSTPDPGYAPAGAPAAPGTEAREPEWDEVDELFRGAG